MARKKKTRPRHYPTIPPFHDPENYVWIDTKEGGHWRRKRGTIKPATLNSSFRKNADTTQITNAAARQMVLRLEPFLKGLEAGRITVRIAGRLKKALVKNNRIDFSFFYGFDVQKDYTLKDLAPRVYSTSTGKNEVSIEIAIHKKTIQTLQRGATGYYFEAIWLYGDPTEDNGLRVDSISSPLFPVGDPTETTCKLAVPLPDKRPYLIFLKASCLEGNALASHPSFYGMQVISAG